MRFVSFNVNSIRTRLHQIHDVVKKHSPDIIGLQETKVTDDDFPIDAIHDLGYEVEFSGQKTHYGVALLSRIPFEKCQKGFTENDEQKRFISGDFLLEDGSTLSIVNGYFPQGESRDHAKKFPNKKQFYQNIREYLDITLSPNAKVIVMGDLNISPSDSDILFNDKERLRWLDQGKCSFLPEEREWFEYLCEWGLHDSYRLCHPDRNNEASWFDFRNRGFDRDPKQGLRIDFILGSSTLIDKCTEAGIDYEIRAMERPSDHCPVWADFNI